jgi:hypothetical protein
MDGIFANPGSRIELLLNKDKECCELVARKSNVGHAGDALRLGAQLSRRITKSSLAPPCIRHYLDWLRAKGGVLKRGIQLGPDSAEVSNIPAMALPLRLHPAHAPVFKLAVIRSSWLSVIPRPKTSARVLL